MTCAMMSTILVSTAPSTGSVVCPTKVPTANGLRKAYMQKYVAKAATIAYAMKVGADGRSGTRWPPRVGIPAGSC